MYLILPVRMELDIKVTPGVIYEIFKVRIA
jgi:hypothetical protein